jgi:MFS family permease
MKMAATWFRAQRGLAIGMVVGALTVGKATPYLVHAFPNAQAREVLLTASAGAVVAGLLIAAFYHDGPHAFAPRRFSWTLVGTVVGRREWRLATGGYLGHMFELYSFWTWIPIFLAASVAAHEQVASASGPAISMLAFGTIAIGGIGCIWGGRWADKHGRERLVNLAMAASGLCALVMPVVFGQSIVVLAPVALAWGFFVIADSAQFSALVTEAVPPHAVGTALTVQTSLGFLLTMVSIQLIPPLVSIVGWRWVFPVLALGPFVGILQIRRLIAAKRAPALA